MLKLVMVYDRYNKYGAVRVNDLRITRKEIENNDTTRIIDLEEGYNVEHIYVNAFICEELLEEIKSVNRKIVNRNRLDITINDDIRDNIEIRMIEMGLMECRLVDLIEMGLFSNVGGEVSHLYLGTKINYNIASACDNKRPAFNIVIVIFLLLYFILILLLCR